MTEPDQPVVMRGSRRTVNGRRSHELVAASLEEIDRGRKDAGLTRRDLAARAEVDAGYLSQIFAGNRMPSVAVLNAIAVALGGRLSLRFYPGTGPRIHDAAQAGIAEELLRIAHPGWRRSVEVAVYRPARGFIDLVLHRVAAEIVVAAEIQSRIDRLEQQLRWMQEKAESLPSSEMWRWIEGDPAIGRLLVLRSTTATRDIARRFEGTLATVFPARAAEVFAALTADVPWPGAGVLWADVHGDITRILDHPPRGIRLGR